MGNNGPASGFSHLLTDESLQALKDALGTTVVPSGAQIEPERANFRALIMANPNYFGNMAETGLAPTAEMSLNTGYEQIGCVGLNPQFDRLEAIVSIKRDAGYGGDVCTVGTPECVRFYLSSDGGATWEDEGLVSFMAHDITGPKPLEYSVALQVDPAKKFCTSPNLLRVRAILSWNTPPPPNTPGYSPVWGNAADGNVQVAPGFFLPFGELLKEHAVELPAAITDAIDVNKPVPGPGPDPGPLSIQELLAGNAEAQVPLHRLLFAHVDGALQAPHPLAAMPIKAKAGGLGMPAGAVVAAPAPMLPPGLASIAGQIDLAKLIAALLQTNGDTTYEQLDCVGLDPNQNTLEGVLTVKLSSGYSGPPCSAGSREYVAFWVDWNDGAGWTYSGTTSVNVHDFTPLPVGGLQYSMFLPVDLTSHRRPCTEGAQIAKVRAILSWQSPPPPANPDFVPHWGNRVESLVEIAPGVPPQPGTHVPFIETVGSMAVSSINGTTGLANGLAVAVGFTAQDSPFGGLIYLTGHLAYPPDVLGGGATPLRYRLLVSSDGGTTWQPVTSSFTVWLTTLTNGVWSGPNPTTQAPVEADGWYEYLEDLTGPMGSGNAMRFVAQNVLHAWQTGSSMEGIWKLKIEAKDPANPPTVWTSNTVTVCLDNEAPTVDLTLTSGSCDDISIGDPVSGTYSVSDGQNHLGSVSIAIQPDNSPPQAGRMTMTPTSPAGPATTSTIQSAGRSYPTLPTSGESGTWELDTTGMGKCGYVVRIDAVDRTIWNSGGPGLWAVPVVLGFCLREPGS